MDITGISNRRTALDILSGYVAAADESTSDREKAVADTDQSAKSDSIDLSKPAEMLSKLQQLKTEDPAKFKELMTEIVKQLTAAAKQEGDTPLGAFLTKLAQKFQDVADGGDISELAPQKSQNQTQSTLPSEYTQSSQLSLVDLLTSQSGTGSGLDELLTGFFGQQVKAISG